VNTLGTYVITYDYSDPSSNAATQVTRTVIVADTIAPVITLNGDATIYLTVNVDTYDESLLGATATDSFDGNLGNVANIVYTPAIDTTTTGTYFVDYSISDAAGNSSTVRRTVEVQDPPGSSNNPFKINTEQELMYYFDALDRHAETSFTTNGYYVIESNLDFQGMNIGYLELYGHLDGQNYTLSNINISTEIGSYIGLFRVINGGSLKNINFDYLNYSNTTPYTSIKYAGLVAGEISDGTVIENLVLTNSTMIVRTSATYAVVGGMIGLVKTSNLTNLSMSNTSIVYAATDSTSTQHLYTGLLFGYLSTNHSGADITINTLTSSDNSLQHDQTTTVNENFPGVIAGYSRSSSSFGILTISNVTSTNDTLLMMSWPSRSDWSYGTKVQNYSAFESNISITSLNLTLIV
jgi:hypothetical protein